MSSQKRPSVEKDHEISVVNNADAAHIDERKLMRRVDMHVIPWLALLYFLNSLDRGTIGNAKVRYQC